MTDDRERWALILGASSGMGEATGLALAKAGYKIAGIHLDFRAALTHVEEVKAAIVNAGSEVTEEPAFPDPAAPGVSDPTSPTP